MQQVIRRKVAVEPKGRITVAGAEADLDPALEEAAVEFLTSRLKRKRQRSTAIHAARVRNTFAKAFAGQTLSLTESKGL